MKCLLQNLFVLVVVGLLLGAGPANNNDVVVDERTQKIIDGAIKYLASRQAPDGCFSPGQHSTAMTGYTLMAFMAAGQLPDEGPHGKNVSRAMKYLLNAVGEDGYISAENDRGSNMYAHGIATIALSELYGQTRDPMLREKLLRAVRLIVNCQNPAGGWRYAPRIGDADISVTVLQVVALRAAKNSGLDVPKETIDRAVGYVRSCNDEKSGGFTYQPKNHQPGFARTAAAIYSLQVCGQYDDPTVKGGSDYLVESFKKNGQQYFTYGCFYAAPAQYMIGGETWKTWYKMMGQMLLTSVQTDDNGMCHWEPIDKGSGVNTIFATAVYTTILAMPYHYIPLYQR